MHLPVGAMVTSGVPHAGERRRWADLERVMGARARGERSSLLLCVGITVVCGGAGCHLGHGDVGDVPSAASRPEVVAVVERVDRNAVVDDLEDGSHAWWSAITFDVVAPESLRHTRVVAYGHPIVDGRVLHLGTRVRFVLPAAQGAAAIPVEDLRGLRVEDE
jgi:hypothetical protein